MESAVIKHRMHGVNLFVLLTRRSSKFSPSEYHLLGHTTLSWCDISFIRIRFALVCFGLRWLLYSSQFYDDTSTPENFIL